MSSFSIAQLCFMLTRVAPSWIYWGISCNLLFLVIGILGVFSLKTYWIELDGWNWTMQKYGWCYVAIAILATIVGWAFNS
ncbi:MAG: hypothetical protein HC878_00105 [Leptolyngbyaceae cyanobacterium SL_5_14]|nr:hypothetical protein [Leptolyngbyaceae cyanobacterium SL_5_14]